MTTATQRLEFRVRPDTRDRIERAAELTHVPVSEFVRAAAEERADEVLRAQHETVVPESFFDDLIAALDAPAEPNAPLRRAAQRARETFTG